MGEIVRFPIIARREAYQQTPEPYDDPRVGAIENLRKAIQRCVRECGMATTKLLLEEAINPSAPWDWRARARKLIDRGGKR